MEAKLDVVYRDLLQSMATVRYWFLEFKRGRKSVFDEERSGRLANVVTAAIIKMVSDMILVDR